MTINMLAARIIREPLTLRDGRRVMLRPIRSEDADLLIDLHNRTSPETQYLRFFGAKPRLTRAEAEYLAGVDYDLRFAIVATADEDGEEHIVAVGRFDIVEPATAEAAVVVRDDYQRQGLGTALLERMVEVARGRGVRTFAGEILAENERMIRLLRNNGLEVGKSEGSVVRASVPIDELPLVLRAFKTTAQVLTDLAIALRPPLRRRSR